MILCDHCNKVIQYEEHCVDSERRDLHPECLEHMQTARLIIDYVALSERRGSISFPDFIDWWMKEHGINTPPADDRQERLRP
jgi:hypothetical protein